MGGRERWEVKRDDREKTVGWERKDIKIDREERGKGSKNDTDRENKTNRKRKIERVKESKTDW